MLINHPRSILLALVITLLAACGGGGGGERPTTGELTVLIYNLPAGVPAAVHVAGPGDFAQDITQSATLANLAPGGYTVTAATVVRDTVTYVPSAPSQSAVVTAGGDTSVSLSYRAVPLALALQEVTTAAAPVFLTSAPGDARLFIVERAGRIRILQDGALAPTPLLDISSRVSTEGEGGLLSMAFHPQYESNGFFFIYFIDTDHNMVIERHKRLAGTDMCDPCATIKILSIPHPTFTNHYGGLVSFGPDGYLYLATGDGGGAGDPFRNAQNLDSLLGKILRIDVSASSASAPYAIPPSNPFAGQAGRRGEIWAYGLRNPFRYTFDGNLLYTADVGQARREEVDIAPFAQGGLNYGWNIMEGTLCFNAASCNQAGLTLPAFDYDHGANGVNGCAIVGGFVYRGKAMPELAGHYFYSDYCGGYLKSFLNSDGTLSLHKDWRIPAIGNIVSFGRDADGELYLLAESGKVFKIVRAPAPRG